MSAPALRFFSGSRNPNVRFANPNRNTSPRFGVRDPTPLQVADWAS